MSSISTRAQMTGREVHQSDWVDRAARIAIRTIGEVLAERPEIERVRMVCFDSRTKAAYDAALREWTQA